MSVLRKEKNCLNCGHLVEDIYCTHCGQKNSDTRINAFTAIGEFIGDYFHADGLFLKSIIPLLFKPGFLSNEFNAGRRARFIHPFRLYIFLSLLFFFLSFISNNHGEELKQVNVTKSTGNRDSLEVLTFPHMVIRLQRDDTTYVPKDSVRGVINDQAVLLPSTLKLYGDYVHGLTEPQKPSFSEDITNRMAIKFNDGKNSSTSVSDAQEKFRQTLPKLLFLLLPISALILKLLYLRRKKYFIEHFVFTLHVHSFIFLLLIINETIRLLFDTPSQSVIIIFLTLLYTFISVRNTYKQSWFKTSLKSLFFTGIYLVHLVVVFGIGFLYIFIFD